MGHPEFTLLGDAVWLDFVNSAGGRTPSPPDLSPDAAALSRWAEGPATEPAFFADSSPNRRRLWCAAACGPNPRVERRRGARR